MSRKEIIDQIKKIIKINSPDASVILYGSEARGDSQTDSDIDILILLEKENLTYQDRMAITGPLFELELKTGISISPVVYTKKQWNNRPFKTPFYINVQNEGILL